MPYDQIPFEKYYSICKNVESEIINYLGELDHEEFLIGLRVAYDFLDSSNEPGVLPYKIEFGYLGPVDSVINCTDVDVADENELLLRTTRSGISIYSLPFDFLDNLYQKTKNILEDYAGQELKIGIFTTLYGSPIKVYSLACLCGVRGARRYKYCYYNRFTKRNECSCIARRC